MTIHLSNPQTLAVVAIAFAVCLGLIVTAVRLNTMTGGIAAAVATALLAVMLVGTTVSGTVIYALTCGTLGALVIAVLDILHTINRLAIVLRTGAAALHSGAAVVTALADLTTATHDGPDIERITDARI